MKRGHLLRHRRRYGCVLYREGKEDTLWENPQTGHTEALPRCPEIAGHHRYFGSARIATQAGPLSVCCVTVFFMPPATATYGTPPIS